jgi:hypothetical protein
LTETSRNPHLAWLAALLAGVVAPAFALQRVDAMTLAAQSGPILAVLVVCGEAATLLTAAWLPAWLLVLLPAQWASAAIATAIAGSGTRAAMSVLVALAGTAVTTLVVARLLPRKWPYALMFIAWLALSALVAGVGADTLRKKRESHSKNGGRVHLTEVEEDTTGSEGQSERRSSPL